MTKILTKGGEKPAQSENNFEPSLEEQHDLIALAQADDADATARLHEYLRPEVEKWARHYWWRTVTREDRPDIKALEQAGHLGLCEAIANFNLANQDNGLGAYSEWYICKAIREEVREWRLHGQPAGRAERYIFDNPQLRRIYNSLPQHDTANRDSLIREVANGADVKFETAKAALDCTHSYWDGHEPYNTRDGTLQEETRSVTRKKGDRADKKSETDGRPDHGPNEPDPVYPKLDGRGFPVQWDSRNPHHQSPHLGYNNRWSRSLADFMKSGNPEIVQRMTERITDWLDARAVDRIIELIWSRCDELTKMSKPAVVERINELICAQPICDWLDERFDKRKIERGRVIEHVTTSICAWLDDRAEALRLANERGLIEVQENFKENNVIRFCAAPALAQTIARAKGIVRDLEAICGLAA